MFQSLLQPLLEMVHWAMYWSSPSLSFLIDEMRVGIPVLKAFLRNSAYNVVTQQRHFPFPNKSFILIVISTSTSNVVSYLKQ